MCLYTGRAPAADVLKALNACPRPLAALCSCLDADTHPSAAYTHRVLAPVLSIARADDALDDDDAECLDRLHDAHGSLLASGTQPADVWIHRRFTLTRGGTPIWLRNSSNMLACATGAHVWPAGLALARLILAHPQRFSGPDARVLELGAGAGLAALCCALKIDPPPASLVISDGSIEAVANLSHNFELNGVHHSVVVDGSSDVECRVRVMHLPWDRVTLELAGAMAPTIVLAADVCYDPADAPSLACALALLLSHNRAACASAIVLVTKRNADTVSCFQHAWRDAGLSWRDETDTILSAGGFQHLPPATHDQGEVVAFTLSGGHIYSRDVT